MQLDQNWFLETISGKRNGLLPGASRCLLFLISLVYRLIIVARNWAYDTGWKRTYQAQLPVISIGNLTTGGTGKTPMVIWLAKRLGQDREVTVISRGYGSQDGNLNDEGLEIEQSCPRVSLIQNPDRVAAVYQLDSNAGSVVVLDDAFQHRRLHRDLDIVLIDASNPFGHGFVLPRGLLREPVKQIRRSDLVILTRANLIERKDRDAIRQRLQQHHAALNWAEAELKLKGWRDANDVEHPLGALDHQKIFAFSAIGNPGGFIETLKRLDVDLVGEKRLNDHHSFNHADLEAIHQAAAEKNAEAIVCTMKDFVKVRSMQIPGLPVYALATELQFSAGLELIDRLLNQTLSELEDSR